MKNKNKLILNAIYDSIREVSKDFFILFNGSQGVLYNGLNNTKTESKYQQSFQLNKYIIGLKANSTFDIYLKSNLILLFSDVLFKSLLEKNMEKNYTDVDPKQIFFLPR